MSTRAMGIHHAGVTVTDLDASLAWWKTMFGLDPVTTVRSEEPLPDNIGMAIGVPGASISYAFLPVGESKVELLQYHAPEGADHDLSNKDVGVMHVAIRIDDVVAQYEHMVGNGARFRHPPIVLDGDLEGVAFAYASDPDGIQVEIWQEP